MEPQGHPDPAPGASAGPEAPAAAPALAGLRALVLGGELTALAARLLADLGVEVLHVEPPEGSPLRLAGPQADGVAEPEAGLAWWAYAGGTRSLVLDLGREADRARLHDLVLGADFLLASLPPGRLDQLGLGREPLRRLHPRLIVTSITPFGETGPHCAWEGPEIVLQAMGGMMHLLGDADRPPVRMGGMQAALQAGGHAAVGTLVAHAARARTGRGQWVEVSAQHAMTWTLLSETGLPPLHGYDPVRDGPHVRAAGFRRRVIFRCRDGWVAIAIGGGVIGAAMMRALTAWMAEEGRAPVVMLERDWLAWDSAYLRAAGARGQQEIDQVVEAVGAFVADKDKSELYRVALERSLLMAPVHDLDDVMADSQLAARGFLARREEPRLGRSVAVPGAWARLSATPLLPPRPAPLLGADTGWADGAPRGGERAEPSRDTPPLPFQGLRVLDFAWVATGPITGRLLAEFGAEVIRVESALRMDPGRTIAPWAEGRAGPNRSQFFANYNAAKRSITLDLSRPRAQEVARQLARRADVLIESFTPGTMARWGLDWPTLSRSQPDLVYLSTCQQGQSGPHAHYRGYGSLAAGLAGFYTVTGWPDREPQMIYGAYTDFVAHHLASAAVLAALDHRRRTGQGQHIDLSQLEAGIWFLAPEVLERTVNRRCPGRRGNAHERWAPHGAYPCAGEDRWCVIACRSDVEWRALRALMGEPGWALDPRLDTAAGRQEHAADLDRRLGEWTREQEPYALALRLQGSGVPAGVVQRCSDLHRDPQLAERGALAWVEHPEMGRTPYETWAFACSETPSRLDPAPCLGADTTAVLREVLALTDPEIAALEAEGVLR